MFWGDTHRKAWKIQRDFLKFIISISFFERRWPPLYYLPMIFLNLPGTCFPSIFSLESSKTRPTFQSKHFSPSGFPVQLAQCLSRFFDPIPTDMKKTLLQNLPWNLDIPLWLRITCGRKSKKFIVKCEYVCCTLFPPKKIHAFLLAYMSLLLPVERVESRLMSQHRMMFECHSETETQHSCVYRMARMALWQRSELSDVKAECQTHCVGGLQQQEHFIVLRIQFSDFHLFLQDGPLLTVINGVVKP